MDNQTIQLILSFALTGVVITSVAQYTKTFLDKSAHRTLYVVALSVIGGLIVYYGHLIPADIVMTIIGVWASANSVYLALKAFGIFGSDASANPTPVVPDSVTPPPPAQPAAGQ